jgi:PPE-repeat protein
VPPPIIAANRSLLAALVATNIVGQNTPAIAATEAQYAEMWAQDAAAMYGYAGASAAATTVTPFNPPPPTTNPAGAGTQAAAVAQAAASPAGAAQNMLSQVPNALQSLASGSIPNALTAQVLSFTNSPGSLALSALIGPIGGDAGQLTDSGFPAVGIINWLGPLYAGAPSAKAAAAELALPETVLPGLADLAGSHASGMGGAGVSAGLGEAATVGRLSVPQSWATASPAIRLAATALPVAGLDGVPQAGAAGLGGSFGGMPMGGMPMMGGLVNAPRNGADSPRPESRLKVIPQLGSAPGVDQGTPDRGMTRAADVVDALSDRERYELQTLRNEIADLAMERDAVDRLIKEAMRR